MSERLSIYLPPFAADYAGVCSVLFDYDCLIVIDDASCCTRGYLACDEPRLNKRAFSSRLRAIEAVMGDEERLITQTVQAIEELKPTFAAVVGSPITSLIGRDMSSVAARVEQCAGVPVLGFDTTGFRYYNHGASMAYIKLLERFGSLKSNSLGAIPLDGYLTAPPCGRFTLMSLSGFAAAERLGEYDMLAPSDAFETAADTLIIGDQVIANSIRDERSGTVASFFGIEPKLARAGDISLADERQLIELLRGGRFRHLIADPIICAMPQASGLYCESLPHPAISGEYMLHKNNLHKEKD